MTRARTIITSSRGGSRAAASEWPTHASAELGRQAHFQGGSRMHVLHRPDRRDWLYGLGAGATLGFVFLGIGARAGMRLIALASGQAAAFTIEGSIAVSLLGALTGVLVAAVFLSLRNILPTRRWTRGVVFWIVCFALALRGLRPVTP